jgi:cysteine desulfurase
MIYLDHNATTPLAPEVRAAMTDALDRWGNPSSVHAVGRQARAAVEDARRQVAALLGVLGEEIVFTSGGTEGVGLAIRGLALAARRASGRAHVVSSPLEHPAVMGALDELRREGFAVTLVPVSPTGQIVASAIRAALRDDTVLVTLALCNHEIGNVYDVAAFAAAAHERGALFHTDAVQAAGRLPIDFRRMGLDAATVSAHKLHGPKGVGAVALRRGLDVHPLIAGGHQERERRAGTENVPGIAGFGVACTGAARDLKKTAARVASLRDRLERQLLAIPGARLFGDADARVAGTTNVGWEGAAGQLVAVGLDLEGICVSTGAACTSGTLAPSPVLLALGVSREVAQQAVRFSLGRETTEAEVDEAAAAVRVVVARVRDALREAA